ncbi:MAG: hypothetical protein JXB46_04285, partial [Candidatus Eisenbacteria bacterium]|nr:hypothetical protein [Candidatus Eisenbacteria bacterium]
MASRSGDSSIHLAVAGAVLMMMHHVGARSLRDALFLDNYDPTKYPLMMMAASGFAIALVAGASWAMKRFTPARLIPASFAVSALCYAALGVLARSNVQASAVLIFLLVSGTGALLTSGFWSLISERFDPNAVRRHVGRIAASGTVGVVLGGALTAMSPLSAVLPMLAVLHAGCALVSYRLAGRFTAGSDMADSTAPPRSSSRSLPELIREASYLRSLGALVLVGTISAGLIDSVFKLSVASIGDGERLQRFFAFFYAGVGTLTFLLQTTASGNALRKLGLGKTLGLLPSTVALGGFAAILVQGLPAVGIARGSESILRGSLFRAAYELFYAPIPVEEKRAAKPVIDVGIDRIGDGLGYGLAAIILLTSPAFSNLAILTLAVLLGLTGIWLALRLDDAYLGVLEENLRHRAGDLELGHFGGSILSSMTMLCVPLSGEDLGSDSRPGQMTSAEQTKLLASLEDLCSRDPSRIRKALAAHTRLDPLLIPAAIEVLASDAVNAEAVRALRAVARDHVGQLVDALLAEGTDPKARRRIPRVLSHCADQRTAEGLLAGLRDPDFEVRLRCCRALGAITAQAPDIQVNPEAVFEAVKREAMLRREELVTAGSGVFLEHVFTLMSLVLPREPLRVAFHGLRATDEHLRGTALEYLETALPQWLRELLWPYLEDHRPEARRGSSREGALRELMESRTSIMLNPEDS